MKPESVHAIITDVPYGIDYEDWDVTHKNTNSALGRKSPAQDKSKLFKRRGKPLNGWSASDTANGKQYQKYCTEFLTCFYHVLMPGSSCLCFNSRRLLAHLQVAAENVGFTTLDVIAWNKLNAPFRAQRVSEVFKRRNAKKLAKQYEGLRLGNLAPIWEPVLWLRKPYPVGGTVTDVLVKHGTGGFQQDVMPYNGNLIGISAHIASEIKVHPTQKPETLLTALVNLVSRPGQIVCDPYAGSGTTAAACVLSGRNFIGMELDKQQYKNMKARIRRCLHQT